MNMMDDIRDEVQATIDSQLNSKKSKMISEEKFNQVVEYLKNADPCSTSDSHFKAWVKERRFQLVSFPGLGLEDVLVIPKDKAGRVHVYLCRSYMYVNYLLDHRPLDACTHFFLSHYGV